VVLTTPACPLKTAKQDCIDALTKALGSHIIVEPEMISRVTSRQIPVEKKDILPKVKNIVAVVSGKGGVGKSTVAATLLWRWHKACKSRPDRC